jgi:hypothetical protein
MKLIQNPVILIAMRRRKNPLEDNYPCIATLLVVRWFACYTGYHHTRGKNYCSGNYMKAIFDNILEDAWAMEEVSRESTIPSQHS